MREWTASCLSVLSHDSVFLGASPYFVCWRCWDVSRNLATSVFSPTRGPLTEMWAEKYTKNKMWKLVLFTLAPNPHEAVCPVSFRLRKFEETRNQPPDRSCPTFSCFSPKLDPECSRGAP